MSDFSGTSTRPVTGAQADVSIIMPVYNVADYIDASLRSICEQQMPMNCEVILVDDCSTDDSVAICRDYIERRPELFRLLQMPRNSGVSAARNQGLAAAKGRYFSFVDPDDLLPRDALLALYQAAEDSAAWIVKGNNTIFDSQQEKPARYNVKRASMVRGDRVLTTLLEHQKVRGHAGGKLFRSDSLGHVRFPEGISMVEDLYYCCEVFSQAQSLFLLNRPVYRYRNRESGATGQKYENGSYRDWLDTVYHSGRFASTRAQRRAHRDLLLRTLTQMARECRNLEPEMARRVLELISEKRASWNIRPGELIFRYRMGVRSMLRYLKFRQALNQLNQALTETI